MRAIVCCPTCPGGIEFRDVPEPVAGRNEVIVEMRATSVNLGNVRRLRWEQDGWRPGYDVAGIVSTAAADGTGPAAGERVAGVVPEQAWAERVAVPTDQVAVLPDGLGFEAAAAVPVAGLTSQVALGRGGNLLGKRVLITGASGGVGRFAIQLARLAGARVTAWAGRPERSIGLADIGAHEVVFEITEEGELFDLVLESVGGGHLRTALARIAPGGTVAAIGATSDEPTTFDALTFIRRGAVTFYGIQLFDEMERQGLGSAELGRLLGLVAAGALDPQIVAEGSWKEMAALLTRLGEREVPGKAVALID